MTTDLLTSNEKIILFIIREYLDQNRIFRLKDIVPFIQERISKLATPLNDYEIQKILWSLIRKKIVLPGSKMTRDTVLENTTRVQVLDFVSKNPGSYYREIMKNLDMGSNEIIWHTTILLNFAFIRYVIIDGRKIFFDNNLRNDFDKEIYYMGDKKINEIIQYVVQLTEGATRSQISNELSMNYNTVVKCLEKLESIGLAAQNQETENITYLLNPKRFKEILDGIESIKSTK